MNARPLGDPNKVDALVDAIAGARQPIILSGSGVIWSKAWPEPDGFGLARNSSVTDIDVVPSSGEIPAGGAAQTDVVTARAVEQRLITVGRVVVAGCVGQECVTAASRVFNAEGVALKRIPTMGRVFVSGCVLSERTGASRGIEVAGHVALERARTGGCIGGTSCQVKECVKTVCRVIEATGEAEERIIASRSVLVGVASVRRRVDRSRHGRERNEGECADETDR